MGVRAWAIGIFAAVVGVPALLVPTAGADHSLIEQLSVGPSGGNSSDTSAFRHASPDGSRVLFTTAEALVGADADAEADIYERANGLTTLITTGTTLSLSFRGASTDGTHVFFYTVEALTPDDSDGSINDVYEAVGGVIRLVSKGPVASGSFFSGLAGTSADGNRVLFSTRDRLVPEDNDGGATDLYERVGGTTTTLLSTSDTAPNSPDNAGGLISRDGARAYFTTAEQLVPQDTDASVDVYERSGGTTKLLSVGTINGNGPYDASTTVLAQSENRPNPGHVLFYTAEALVPEDTDSCNPLSAAPGCQDIYESDGTTAHLVTASETGTASANEDIHSAIASDDGTHVVFRSSEQLVAADMDAVSDVYERFAGHTILVSTGPVGGNGPFAAGGTGPLFAAASAISGDGTHVFFSTEEKLTPEDSNEGCGNGCLDLYDRSGGNTALVTTGPGEAPASSSAPTSVQTSFDGSRVFFTTQESLVAADPNDGGKDLYERVGGTTFLIPPTGAGTSSYAAGLTPDGSTVFIHSDDSFGPADSDAVQDVYSARIAPDAYARPKAATPINVALVPAYAACTSPNRVHAAPLSFNSCAPPAQTSNYLTLGTPDANGAGAKAIANLRLLVLPGNPSTPANEADARYEVSITDVRNKSDLTDYTGALLLNAPLQITDRNNSDPDGGSPNATGSQPVFPVVAFCAATADTTIGSTCSNTTTANSIAPGAAVEGKRAIWETGQVRVFDGGADGNPATSDGDAVFLVQGVFIP